MGNAANRIVIQVTRASRVYIQQWAIHRVQVYGFPFC